jgi:hypothetical protein
MNDNKFQWVAGFLIAGLVLLGLSASLINKKSPTPPNNSRLARVTHDSGTVSLLHPNLSQKEKIEFSAPAYHLDSVETDDTGDASMEFEHGGRIRLFPNSLVTLAQEQVNDQSHVVVILKHGDIKVEKVGTAELLIAKNGERLNAAEYNGSQLQQTPVTPAIVNNDSTGMAAADKGLSEQDISAIMNNYRASFFKCYTQLLQKEPTAKGDASLSFTIENNGKMSAADVVSSNIKNDDFKKCLLEVLRRIEFRSFSGPPISTLFPLKFE